jgi:LuxR family maltose regulon positive regulatory protein
MADEVLDQQPEPLRQFLLESAVLPEMEPQVCNEVLGRLDSAGLLRQAETYRLFISATGEDFRTYQYHHLFRDFLIAKLRSQDPDRLKALRVRAAEWYSGQGMAEAAVTFYAMAEELAQAAEVVEVNAQTMFERGRYTTLKQWAEQLAPIAYDVPTLYLYLGRADIDTGQLVMAETEVDTAFAGYARHANEEGCVKAQILRSMVLYRRGDFGRALAIAKDALPRAQSPNLTVVRATAHRYAGLCQFALGQLVDAEQELREAETLLRTTPERYGLAWALQDLANVLRVRGYGVNNQPPGRWPLRSTTLGGTCICWVSMRRRWLHMEKH